MSLLFYGELVTMDGGLLEISLDCRALHEGLNKEKYQWKREKERDREDPLQSVLIKYCSVIYCSGEKRKEKITYDTTVRQTRYKYMQCSIERMHELLGEMKKDSRREFVHE